MDNDNFSYTFYGASNIEWRVEMKNGKLIINDTSYERQDVGDDPTYDFAIAMHRIHSIINGNKE